MATSERGAAGWVVRVAGVLLAVSSAWVLTAFAREGAVARPYSPFARALLVTTLFQVGLFWAPSARSGAMSVWVAGALLYGWQFGSLIRRRPEKRPAG